MNMPILNIKDKIKHFMSNAIKVRDVLCFTLGIVLASYVALQLYNWRMQEVTKQGCVVYDKKVWLIQVKP